MYEKLNEQIAQAQENIEKHQTLKETIILLEREKKPIDQKAKQLYETLQNENLDVEKLQRMSFKKAIYALLSQLVERTEKEKREALAAKLNYDLASKDLDDINKRLEEKNSELSKLVNCRKEYHNLYNQKKELLSKSSPQMSQMLMDKSKQLNKLIHTEKTARKALEYSEQASEALNNAAYYLTKAQDWAAWEGRRGFIIKAIKETYLEDTHEAIYSARRHIRSLNEQLSALGISASINMEMVYFNSDSLYGEFFNRTSTSKMSDAHDIIGLTKARIYSAVNSLNKLRGTASKGAKRLRTELDTVILDGVNE